MPFLFLKIRANDGNFQHGILHECVGNKGTAIVKANGNQNFVFQNMCVIFIIFCCICLLA